MSGCTTDSNPLGPLVYTQQVSGNISTILWPAGAARSSLTDTYAPDFRWRRADSTLDSLSNHHGQVVLVNFWATWCEYCKAEMPAIQSAVNQMGDTLFVIGVSVDDPGNPFTAAQSYVKSNGYTYQFAVDSNWTLYEKYFPNQGGSIPQCQTSNISSPRHEQPKNSKNVLSNYNKASRRNAAAAIDRMQAVVIGSAAYR